MSDSERFALAARLYTAFKRHSGRIIDVIWLQQNEAYLHEILRLAAAGDAECAELGQRYAALVQAGKSSAGVQFNASGQHYVRGLR